MGTLLVTGGAGFIGSNFVRHALDDTDDHVVVLDKLTYAGSLKSLADVEGHERFTFVKGDIADFGHVERLLAEHRPTSIVNFAAETHVDRSIDEPGGFVQTNIVGAFRLLEAGRKHLASLDETERSRFRLLHVSTDEVYGSLGPEGLFSETTPYAPNSPYAASKAAADHLARAYYTTFGMPVLLTNCSNNYGPYQFPEKLIPLKDHCAGILLVLERGRLGESYNLGGGNEQKNIDVVDTICDILERIHPATDNPALKAKGIARYHDLKTFVPDRAGHDRRYAIDATKIRQELGWTPKHDFTAGMEATLRWYLDNRAWCDAVQAEASYNRERLGL
jgi:dTDP-glucose 4,6-dehydratase